MIAFFPKAYEDELLYSQICRYHVRTGNSIFRSTADDIYAQPNVVRPSFEFVNRFTDDAVKWICKDTVDGLQGTTVKDLTSDLSENKENDIAGDKTIEAVIRNRTMFNAYVRFLPKEKRIAALKALCSQEGNWNNIVGSEQSGESYARYCPLCAKEDRDNYGETYWHRTHQIRNLTVCPKHNCYLENSTVKLYGRTSPGFYDAESYVPKDEAVRTCVNLIQLTLNKYIVDVFNEPIDIGSNYPVGVYLHRRLSIHYVTDSGLVRNLSRLHADIKEFYGKLECPTQSQLQKIFNGYRFNNYDVLQLAFFEGVSAYDITHLPVEYKLPGLDSLYKELADKHDININTVKAIGEEVLKFTRKITYVQNKCGPRVNEWEELDNKLLPEVKRVVDDIYSGSDRPRRVTYSAVTRALNLPQKQIFKLEQCMSYIDSKKETSGEYWAREVTWAINKLKAEDKELSKVSIARLTNMRYKDVKVCYPYIKDEGVKEIIWKLFMV